MYKKFTYLIMAVFSILLLSGCGGKKVDTANPKFIRAKKFYDRERFEPALDAFKEYLLINPESLKTHKYLADLYYDHMNLPLQAIYHYQMQLELAPNSTENTIILKFMKNAEEKYYKSLEEQYAKEGDIGFVVEQNTKLNEKYLKYYNASKKLYRQNTLLKRSLDAKTKLLAKNKEEISQIKTAYEKKLNGMKKQLEIGSIILESRNDKPVKRAQSTARKSNKNRDIPGTYVIKSGDSLSKISQKVYGSSKYYKRIFQANLDKIPTVSSLKVGERIKIPQLN